MLDENEFARVMKALPFLEQADESLIKSFKGEAFLARIPNHKNVYLQGDVVDHIALLLQGQVRVFTIGETGREITLYRFGLGESCILTANAILGHKTFPAIATVEEEAEAVLIPADAFRNWVKSYDLWREFVFDLLSERLSTIMAVVEEVVFNRMDQRIASWLVKNSEAGVSIETTHQEIAFDLGSSREVISRILDDFSQKGWIIPRRGSIEILDLGPLEKLAGM